MKFFKQSLCFLLFSLILNTELFSLSSASIHYSAVKEPDYFGYKRIVLKGEDHSFSVSVPEQCNVSVMDYNEEMITAVLGTHLYLKPKSNILIEKHYLALIVDMTTNFKDDLIVFHEEIKRNYDAIETVSFGSHLVWICSKNLNSYEFNRFATSVLKN